ncbi:probable E3 ubiquitin-protein ligase RHG1A [Neltuma alba]|uniref:probable E3 ubiquitin-protein ligase RHG1A n=1 Tax=Neltuma alba TaxID=207710 RepID=UPI0010A49AAC|nr:probable E3 ubiquitin-protein ligase RHG1A [Prosopis alba]
MPTLLGVGNQSAAAPIGFPVPSGNNLLDLNPPAISRERDLAIVINNAGFQNQLRTSQRSEDQSYLNIGPPFTDEARNILLTQELLIIDYSLLLYLPADNNNEEDDEQDEETVAGLSEEDVMANLRLEEFQTPTGVTPENVDPCCICQENYADGEDMGVLDCRHKFHYDCIKNWLGIKNTCPICVQTGLAVS